MSSCLNIDQRRLVEDNLHLIAPIARRVRRLLPDCVTWEEVESCGREGLCIAALSYEPGKGPFNAWAKLKIRGTILDANTGSNWPKNVCQIDWMNSQCLTMAPEDENSDEKVTWIEGTMPEDSRPNPELHAIDRQDQLLLNARLRLACQSLSQEDLHVLKLAQTKDTLHEIGSALGVSITTAHRLRKAVYSKLRPLLSGEERQTANRRGQPGSFTNRRRCEHRSFRK